MSMNPVGSVQFDLAGGWKSAVLMGAGYVGITLLIVMTFFANTPPQNHGSLFEGFLSIVSLLQAILLLIVAPSAVRRAVQRDLQTGMMESHRLTPLSGARIALGYITGAPSNFFTLAVVSAVLGATFAIGYGQKSGFPLALLAVWAYGNLCLVALAFLAITLALIGSLGAGGKGQIGFFIAGAAMGGPLILVAVPGVALLMGAMSIGEFVSATGLFGFTVSSNDPSVTIWAMVLQTMLALVLLRAASWKLRSPHRALFSVPLGLAFLAIVACALVVGYQKYSGFARIFGLGNTGNAELGQTAFSVVAFQIAALIPLLAAADYRLHADRAQALETGKPGRGWRLIDLLPLALALATPLLMTAMLTGKLAEAELVTGLLAPVFVAALVNALLDYGTLYVALARRWKLFWTLAAMFVLIKISPFIIEVGASIAAEESGQVRTGEWFISAFSPYGTLVGIAQDAPVGPGLAWQVVTAIVVLAIARRARLSISQFKSYAVRPAPQSETIPPTP